MTSYSEYLKLISQGDVGSLSPATLYRARQACKAEGGSLKELTKAVMQGLEKKIEFFGRDSVYSENFIKNYKDLKAGNSTWVGGGCTGQVLIPAAA